MKHVMLQKAEGALHPFTPEDEDVIAELKPNQVSVWSLDVKGVLKQRSFQQLKLVMAAIRVVVANTEDPNWETVDKAKLSLKIALSYVDPDAAVVLPDGTVVLNYRSFGYADLGHMEACNLFDRAFPILAGVLQVDAEDLVQMAMEGQY
jgi:hypothetical protein